MQSFRRLIAMLQFGGTLINTSARITPRMSWYISSQYLSSASTAATPVLDVQLDQNKNIEIKPQPIESNKTDKKSHKTTIDVVFEKVFKKPEPNINNTLKNSEQIKGQILKAKNINQLLELVEYKYLNQEHASFIMYIIHQWLSSGKISMINIEKDVRYLKICNILGVRTAVSKLSLNTNQDLLPVEDLLQMEKLKQLLSQTTVLETIRILRSLAATGDRTLITLTKIANKITASENKLDVKSMSDVLYCMARLTFYNEELMKKMCTDLNKVILESKITSVIGSILKSLGLLYYRDEQLLDTLSTWIVTNKNLARPQDIHNLLLTLASVGYLPKNFKELDETILQSLNENDMSQSIEWLGIVWSLCVLNQVRPEQCESVLKADFLQRVFVGSQIKDYSSMLKLLNINAVAQFMIPDYKGPLLPEDSEYFQTTLLKSKEKKVFFGAVTSALKMFLPSDSLTVNVNTNMGFIIDAEFCIDDKCTPISINSISEKDVVHRVAVIACTYHDYCRGEKVLLKGPVQLQNRLLENRGYKLLIISYADVDMKDKLINRVKYINENLKSLISDKTYE